MEIREETPAKAWKKALKQIMKSGFSYKDHEGRICKEILNIIITVRKPEKDTLAQIQEINSLRKWVYPSSEEIASSILNDRLVSGYYYTYGQRAFNFKSGHEGINQVDKFVIPLLKKDPTSRKAIIVFHNPIEDSLLYRKEIPGIVTVDFKLRNKMLHVTAVIRSNDLFLGWPADLYQIKSLQDYVASKLDCKAGSITTLSISAHVFEEHFEDISKILSK